MINGRACREKTSNDESGYSTIAEGKPASIVSVPEVKTCRTLVDLNSALLNDQANQDDAPDDSLFKLKLAHSYINPVVDYVISKATSFSRSKFKFLLESKLPICSISYSQFSKVFRAFEILNDVSEVNLENGLNVLPLQEQIIANAALQYYNEEEKTQVVPVTDQILIDRQLMRQMVDLHELITSTIVQMSDKYTEGYPEQEYQRVDRPDDAQERTREQETMHSCPRMGQNKDPNRFPLCDPPCTGTVTLTVDPVDENFNLIEGNNCLCKVCAPSTEVNNWQPAVDSSAPTDDKNVEFVRTSIPPPNEDKASNVGNDSNEELEKLRRLFKELEEAVEKLRAKNYVTSSGTKLNEPKLEPTGSKSDNLLTDDNKTLSQIDRTQRDILDCLNQYEQLRDALQELDNPELIADTSQNKNPRNACCSYFGLPHIHATLNGIGVIIKMNQAAIDILLAEGGKEGRPLRPCLCQRKTVSIGEEQTPVKEAYFASDMQGNNPIEMNARCVDSFMPESLLDEAHFASNLDYFVPMTRTYEVRFFQVTQKDERKEKKELQPPPVANDTINSNSKNIFSDVKLPKMLKRLISCDGGNESKSSPKMENDDSGRQRIRHHHQHHRKHKKFSNKRCQATICDEQVIYQANVHPNLQVKIKSERKNKRVSTESMVAHEALRSELVKHKVKHKKSHDKSCPSKSVRLKQMSDVYPCDVNVNLGTIYESEEKHGTKKEKTNKKMESFHDCSLPSEVSPSFRRFLETEAALRSFEKGDLNADEFWDQFLHAGKTDKGIMCEIIRCISSASRETLRIKQKRSIRSKIPKRTLKPNSATNSVVYNVKTLSTAKCKSQKSLHVSSNKSESSTKKEEKLKPSIISLLSTQSNASSATNIKSGDEAKPVEAKTLAAGSMELLASKNGPGYIAVLHPICGCPEVSIFIPCYCDINHQKNMSAEKLQKLVNCESGRHIILPRSCRINGNEKNVFNCSCCKKSKTCMKRD